MLLLYSAGTLSKLSIQKSVILGSPRHSPDFCWETSRQATIKWDARNTLSDCSWKHRYFYSSHAIHQICPKELQMADGKQKHSHGRCVHPSAEETCKIHPTGTAPKQNRYLDKSGNMQSISENRGRYQNWTLSVRACKDISKVYSTI